MRRVARFVKGAGRALIRRLVPARPAVAPIAAAEPPARPQPTRFGKAELAALGDEKVVLFFAPEAGVVPHYMANCVVAKSLQERGHRVLFVRCFDVYPQCIVMDSMGLVNGPSEADRTSICVSCHNGATEMTAAYGLSVVDLRDFADEALLWEIDQLTAQLPEDLTTFEFEGVRFGKFCGAMAAVMFKTTDFGGSDPAVRALLIKYLKGSLISYRAVQKLSGIINISRIVHYNQYAMLLSAALAARRAGVPTTNMSLATIRAVDRRRIVFMTEMLSIATFRHELREWPNWRNLAMSDAMVAELGDDTIYRISSNSVFIYSPVHTGAIDDLFARLNLRPERRLLVAFTSSLDELAANNHYLESVGMLPFPEKQPFRDQIEWLEALIERVERSPDLQLVVRIHPREGANRRDSVVSTHLGILRRRFSRPFEHVRIVWPEDPISSYDLMELADVGLSAWSFTGLEMARFGVPTVVAFDLHTPFPIGDVVLWKESRDGYFECLDQALRTAPSLDQIRFAYRWSHLRFLGCAFDLGDVIPDSNFVGLPTYRTPAEGAKIESVLVDGRSALDINREALLNLQGPKRRGRRTRFTDASASTLHLVSLPRGAAFR